MHAKSASAVTDKLRVHSTEFVGNLSNAEKVKQGAFFMLCIAYNNILFYMMCT